MYDFGRTIGGQRSPSLTIGNSALGLCAFLIFLGCGRPEVNPNDEADTPVVTTVSFPLKVFAEEIGGDMVKVVFPTIEGDPAFWRPTPEDVAAFQQADLILLNGAGYAQWVDKVSLPAARLCDTSAGFKHRYIPLEEAVAHTHGPGGAHDHGKMAFTTWLDLALAVEQSRAVQMALARLLPEAGPGLVKRQERLEQKLYELDTLITPIIGTNPGLPVIFSHPVYQYLQKRYGMNGRSLHWEPDAAPTEEMWEDLTALLKEHPATWMIWEGAPLPETAARLKTVGVESVVFDPCGNTPEGSDYFATMKQNIMNLEQVYRP